MNRLYHQTYYQEHFELQNGGDYEDRDFWYPFFEQVASRLKEEYAPVTVLDAGCAFGYLVEALRNLGILAYGMDVSEYSILHTNPKIREFCTIQSITEPLPEQFPKKFDLVISIEVLEHLTPEEGEAALKNLCSYTDTFIFSSTDSDLQDVTHINVQRKEYWARLFAKYSFFRDVQMPAVYISSVCDVYRRRIDIENVIQEYEIMLRIEKDMKQTTGRKSLIYCDTGSGFRETEKLILEQAIIGQRLQCCVELSEQVERIRFDPMEDSYCMIADFKVSLNGTSVTAVPVNAKSIDKWWIFDTTDPQIQIEAAGPGQLILEGTVLATNEISLPLSLLLQLVQNTSGSEEELKKWKENCLRQFKTYQWRK